MTSLRDEFQRKKFHSKMINSLASSGHPTSNTISTFTSDDVLQVNGDAGATTSIEEIPKKNFWQRCAMKFHQINSARHIFCM